MRSLLPVALLALAAFGCSSAPSSGDAGPSQSGCIAACDMMRIACEVQPEAQCAHCVEGRDSNECQAAIDAGSAPDLMTCDTAADAPCEAAYSTCTSACM